MPNNIHVSYDLNKSGQDYSLLIDAIKAYGKWAKINKSTWWISTSKTASQVAADLWSKMDSNDVLYVVDAKNNAASWYNVDDAASSYIKANWSY